MRLSGVERPEGARVVRQAALFFAVLLVARILAIHSVYFYEEDEIALAVGAATLVRDTIGDLYRYTPQLGYYRLVEILDRVLGSDVSWIPGIMKGLSALAGATLPVLALFAFKSELSSRERWIAAFSVAINPIVWKSSQYGNTAILAVTLATTSLVVLSNPSERLGRGLAFLLMVAAILVRADSVLLLPLMAFLLLRHGSLRTAALSFAGFGLLLLVVYGAIFAFDSRIDSASSAVAGHMLGLRETLFWEYLLWAISPLPIAFSIWGARTLLDSRLRLLVSLALWSLPVMFFYFKATTTPRYFLACAFPLSIAAAVAINEIAGRLGKSVGTTLAWSVVGLAAGLHLFVALGHFSYLSQPFRGAFIITDDRAMPTGALLYATYSDPNVLLHTLPDPQFGRRPSYWEPLAFQEAIRRLSHPEAGAKNVVILFSGVWSIAFHYHAHVAGVQYLSQDAVNSSTPYDSVTWLQIGNSRVMYVNRTLNGYSTVTKFDVKEGDEVWVVGEGPFPDDAALSRMPKDLALLPADSFESHFRIFTVNKTSGDATHE
jgi:hypothetical protein